MAKGPNTEGSSKFVPVNIFHRNGKKLLIYIPAALTFGEKYALQFLPKGL
jgi:hypothetical protein